MGQWDLGYLGFGAEFQNYWALGLGFQDLEVAPPGFEFSSGLG